MLLFTTQVQNVDVDKKTAEITYLSGETEQLELEEIINSSHMTLLT